MGHDHAGHPHGVGAESDARWLWVALLGERFGIEHTTLQVDHERERQLIELEESGPTWQ